MKIGFTGTQRGMTQVQTERVRELLKRFQSGVNKFYHGDCIGADAQAAAIAKELGYEVIAWPPDNSSKRAFFSSDASHVPMPYLERNKAIVRCSKIMIATPGERKEQLRSGTWSTFRYALKMGVPTMIVVP